MNESDLQALCARGQDELMRTDYLRAEKTLVEAEAIALNNLDYDTLARLYMPLQEARRQRRQTCGEGVVKLDVIARGPGDTIDPQLVIQQYPHGQFLIAGWGTIAPAARFRKLQAEQSLYVETFLAAAYPTTTGQGIVIVPLEDVALPTVSSNPVSMEQLRSSVPSYCLLLDEREIPVGEQRGTWATYAHVMSLWERLHAPFLKAADDGVVPERKIEGYRRAIEVDYACELAHQKLAQVAHQLARNSAVQKDAT